MEWLRWFKSHTGVAERPWNFIGQPDGSGFVPESWRVMPRAGPSKSGGMELQHQPEEFQWAGSVDSRARGGAVFSFLAALPT